MRTQPRYLNLEICYNGAGSPHWQQGQSRQIKTGFTGKLFISIS